MRQIQLGSRVCDRLTGFVGIAIGRHEYLYGCTRISVQPTELKDNRVQSAESFDEPQLEVMEVAAFIPERPAHSKTGGPRNDPHWAARPQ